MERDDWDLLFGADANARVVVEARDEIDVERTVCRRAHGANGRAHRFGRHEADADRSYAARLRHRDREFGLLAGEGEAGRP